MAVLESWDSKSGCACNECAGRAIPLERKEPWQTAGPFALQLSPAALDAHLAPLTARVAALEARAVAPGSSDNILPLRFEVKEPVGPGNLTTDLTIHCLPDPKLEARVAALEAENARVETDGPVASHFVVTLSPDAVEQHFAPLVARVATLEAENARLVELTGHLVEWATMEYESEQALNRIKAWIVNKRLEMLAEVQP